METKIVRSVSEFNSELRLQGFKAFQIEDDSNATRVYSRKDFFKICLTTGKSKIHYADKSFEQEGTILFFGNPHIPYSWETISTTYAGYTCLFSEDFLKQADRAESVQQSPFFKIGGTPVLKITEDQRLFLNTLFEKMIEEQKSDYTFKDELIRNYINLIIHEVAHKLDTRNGDRASGVPLIPLREVAGWEHDLHAAMDNIQDEIDLVGESAASIDAYAATDPAECFAVLSEYLLCKFLQNATLVYFTICGAVGKRMQFVQLREQILFRLSHRSS